MKLKTLYIIRGSTINVDIIYFRHAVLAAGVGKRLPATGPLATANTSTINHRDHFGAVLCVHDTETEYGTYTPGSGLRA